MRRRLLLLCFTLSLCTSSFAIDSGNYLVRNVATGKYWGSANSWGTQASLVDNPEYVTWTQLDDGKYHLESQVNNGEKAYYFNGDFMDNDTPVALVIEQRANGYYTISNGEIYYGYDGSSTVLGKTETDPTAANVQWEIVSVADATAALGQATQAAPMNATFLIADPNFGRNNRHYNAWTFEASNKNNEGDVTNYCVESWHATFTMSQTVTVPNGVYGLTAQGFYAQDGSDESHLPVFFLNDATQTFPVRQGEENSMALASASFSQGLYATQPIFVNVTDGTLTLGARLEGNTQLWCIWDNFTLLYYGTAADHQQMTFDVRFSKKVAEVNSLLTTEDVTTEGRRQLNEALAAFNTINANSVESAQQSVEQQIDAAVAYAKDGLALVGQLAACYNKYGERVGAAGSSDQTLTGTLAAIISAISGHTYESNAQIEEWIEALTTARKQYFPYEYRYWFDNDERTEHTDLSNTPKWSFDADISNLKETLHTLHFQVSDEEGTLSVPVTRFFVKTINPTANYGRYWFDDAIDQMQTSTQMQGAFDIDVSQLPEGFHILHYQVVGSNGNVSGVVTRQFYKLYMPTMSSWRCWFDNDFSTLVTGTDFGKTILLDVSSLVDGYHVLHIQADGGKGVASTPITRPFIKTPQVVGVDHLTCLCMIDDQLYKQEQVSANGGVVEWKFDVSSLSQGFHRVFIQVVTPSGAATSAYQSFFMRETTSAEFAQMKCVYAIDGAEFYTEAGQVDDGTYNFDLDVSSLDDGLHRITYMLSNGFGVSTKAQTQFFMKTPLGGNGITEYWYWLNDQADSNATKVKLPERQDPFSLISLLPVESQPLRSSLFQFRIEQDKPVIYAKNDIHIRFYDAAGRFTDFTKSYVDERERMEVTDVTLLESGVRATTAKPTENTIKWYKVTAEQGDSLSFKLDRAASIQLFSPSGEELYAASGAEATNWGGCHAEEDGTFYVALHDVTAQQGSTISIDYEHIDKYAVLRQDVAVVGNSGNSTITFYGNGFDELTNLYLVLQSDTLYAVETNCEGKAVVSAMFNFDGATLGLYKAVFQFQEGKLEVGKCITVEEATDIAINVTATFGKNNLISFHKTKYVFSIHNSGNITAYDVPLMIRVYTHDGNSLERVDIEGYDLKQDFKKYLGISYTDSLDNVINQKMAISGDRCFFLEADSIDIVAGWAAHMHQVFINPTIPPNSTKNIVVSLELGQAVYCYMWHPEVWNEFDTSNTRRNGRLLASSKSGCSKYVLHREEICNNEEWYYQQKNERLHPNLDCSDIFPDLPCPGDGGGSSGDGSHDPNEITGYTSESGSKFIKDEILALDYVIEFENDTTFATASAHKVVVKDTLDSRYFDLNSFKPTTIMIGEKTIELDGSQNFVKTIDMRPEIYSIAQVEGTFDKVKGIATWTFTSLDPMTGEPTEDFMSGFLPVNYDGTSGIGKVFFDINLKQQFAQGVEIPNRAGIVFDKNEVIMTPTWTNVIDATAPESHVSDVKMLNDSTASVCISATDELSGPWRYNVYVQYGSGAWFLGAENVPIDTTASVKVYEGINHGFYTIVTDSAGNVEQKEAAREFTFEVFGSQMDTNTKIELAQGWNWVSHNQQEPLPVSALQPAGARMVGQTEELYNDTRFGWMGDLEELLPTQMYKLQLDEPMEVQLSGRLFNAGFRSIPLYEGWNWMGYPVANTMAPAEALSKLEAEEGDMLIGQDGLATYSEGQWQGTLTTMNPGQGYMYRSASDKNLFLNATAQASARRVNGEQFSVNSLSLPEEWSVDKRKYPNVMGVIGQLWNGNTQEDAAEWQLGAFCGDECRGISQAVNGMLMMNVYGMGGEQIGFRVLNQQTGEMLSVSNLEDFRPEVLGTMAQPYELHIGAPTGMKTVAMPQQATSVYDLMGRRLQPSTPLGKGVYVVTDGEKRTTQKVIRR